MWRRGAATEITVGSMPERGKCIGVWNLWDLWMSLFDCLILLLCKRSKYANKTSSRTRETREFPRIWNIFFFFSETAFDGPKLVLIGEFTTKISLCVSLCVLEGTTV